LAILAWLLRAANILLIRGMSACCTPQAGWSWVAKVADLTGECLQWANFWPCVQDIYSGSSAYLSG